MHRELVKELTLEVQNQQQQKAVKTVRTLGKAASQIKSFPVFFKNFIQEPITTRGRSVEDRLKAIKEVNQHKQILEVILLVLVPLMWFAVRWNCDCNFSVYTCKSSQVPSFLDNHRRTKRTSSTASKIYT